MNFIGEDFNCAPVKVRFHLANSFLSAVGEQEIRWPINNRRPARFTFSKEILADRQSDNHVEESPGSLSDHYTVLAILVLRAVYSHAAIIRHLSAL
jgi:hypothetical protein